MQKDKVNSACVAAFVELSAKGNSSLILFQEIVDITDACFDVVEWLQD